MSATSGRTGDGARLHVDRTACDGRGLCAELLPEVLAADPWGYPTAAPGPDGTTPAWPRRAGLEVAPGLLRDARRAVRACPRLALRLELADRPGA